MTDFAAEIKTILSTPLALIATGGIYTLDDLGRSGLNYTNKPAAFTNTHIKPTAVIKQRATIHVPGMNDDPNHISAASVVVEIWLYEDTGYTNINLMRDTIYPLLHGNKLSNGHIYWNQEIREQRDLMLDANVERVDYKIIHIKGG